MICRILQESNKKLKLIQVVAELNDLDIVEVYRAGTGGADPQLVLFLPYAQSLCVPVNDEGGDPLVTLENIHVALLAWIGNTEGK